MSKTKKLLTALMLLIAVLLIPNMVNATEEDTTTVRYTRSFPSNDGTIELNFTGLTLDESKAYEFALVSKGGTPETWNSITSYTATTAKINLTESTENIRNVLKVADEGQIFIREKDVTTGYVLDRTNVDLKLPYSKAISYDVRDGGYYVFKKYDSVEINSYYFSKITDTSIIEKYLELKNGNGNTLELANYISETIPNASFSTWSSSLPSYWGHITSDFVKNDGLYLLWVKMSGSKDIYGYIIHDGLPNATTLEEYVGVVNGAPTIDSVKATGGSLDYTASKVFEYHAKPNNEVSVNIKFDQAIVKNTAPTLTIKFGTGSNIELKTCEASSDTLTYKYTIKEGDLGTLQIVSLTGGNVTNNNGTQAVLTLPELSGYKVVAVEGTAQENEGEKTQLFIRENSSLNKYIDFPSEIKYEDFFEKYEGKATLKNNLQPVTIVHQYAFVNHEKINEWNAKKAEMTDEEFEAFLAAEIKKYINENNWKNFSDLEVSIANWNMDNSDVVLFVKIETDTEIVTVYNGYGKGFSSIGKDNTNSEGKQPATTDKDTTVANKELPKTGKVLLIWIIGIVTVSGTVAFVRYKKLYM